MANLGRPLEECSRFTRGGGPPTPDHDADYAARAKRLKAEEERLVEWAKAHRKIGKSKRLPEFSRGGEHQVYFDKRSRRYVKATLPHKQLGYGIALGSIIHGAIPSEYLDRLDLQNRLFSDDIRFERVVITAEKPVIVTSQPAVKGEPPLQKAIDDLMTAKGFEQLAEGAYYDAERGLLLFDLFPRNAIQTSDGNIYPIDPVIQRIAPDFADFLRHQPHTINLR